MDKDRIKEFFHLTLIDISEGASLEELHMILKMYEEEEDFEACAGILKAINTTKYQTIQNINDTTNDRSD